MITNPGEPTPRVGPENMLPLPVTLLQALGQALRSIRYGTIELVIHDGRVVQLEKREKVRVKSEVTEVAR